MYIVLNSDIKMSKGKACAQASHSAVKASHLGKDKDIGAWMDWWDHSYVKITLKASEYQIKEILNVHRAICVSTIDEGRTQISKGSLTSIAFIPMYPKDVPTELKILKLL